MLVARGLKTDILAARAIFRRTRTPIPGKGIRCGQDCKSQRFIGDDYSTMAKRLCSYVEAEEIFDYFKGCAIKWDLMRHIKLEHQVRSADWNEDASEWKLLIDGPGGQIVHDHYNVLISASGVLK